jgi:hypothetical protein
MVHPTDYEITTYDPGWTLTIIVVAVCSILNLSLPLFLRLGDYCEKKRLSQRHPCSPTNTLDTTRVDDPPSEEKPASAKDDSPSYDCLKPNSTASDIPGSARNGVAFSPETQGPRNSPSNARSSAPSIASDRDSVASGTVVSSTYLSHIASAVLDARPTKMVHDYHHHRHAVRRQLMKEEEELRKKKLGETKNESDDSSVCPSLMSNLDEDAVSVQDAIDAQEGIVPDNFPMKGLTGWERMLEVADWDSEMKGIVSLTVPYTIQGVSNGVFQILIVAVIGHFVGVREANAYIVVNILVNFTNTITNGFIGGKRELL